MEARILAGCGAGSMGCSRAGALSATFTCPGRTSAGVASVAPVRAAAGAGGRSSYRITVLSGDGIGPESIKVTKNCLQTMASQDGMGVFTHLRPAAVLPQLVDASTVKGEVAEGVDMLEVRDFTGGLYVGQPNGFRSNSNREQGGFNTEGCSASKVCYQVALRRSIFNKTVDAVWGIYGQSTTEQPRSHASIVASLDSDAGKADGARKALEQAFQGKNNLAKKWEEEIRKRELSGGDGVSGGGSKGGSGGGGWGGGGGDDEMGEGVIQDEPWDWEEIGQTFMATFALLMLYLSITHGPRQILKKFKLLFRYIRQGFKLRKIPDEYLTAEGSGIPSDDEELDEEDEDDYADSSKATAEVIRQRGADGQEAGVLMDDASDDETEDDKEDVDNGIPTLPPTKQSRTEEILRKRQAETKEKVRQLLTPKELRQQQEETK